MIRELYDIYGYQEVITLNIYNKCLWKTSGHWEKYRENMFILEDFHHNKQSNDQDTDNKANSNANNSSEQMNQFANKPMNCPGYCLVFRNMKVLSKDLPIRMAEFAVLHRNEASGALHGLNRVRRFQHMMHIFFAD